ncbi:metallophosphoesterase family protein [Puniceibacterium sediminis]|uniref:3',5'-cyclic AMP phosphodiesterase CpdA n=1 Tax=Puniceibacterium sediminis TaxID=1608407 RepID=A0A238WBX5_9RHOB|nr:metallophosphoesterase [Puniceibacterium sediminis]SNR43743.1 3',5'-cyclic AMP phosphodiesterase CpdA [Puniceibacterium sediminis]
MTRIVHLSDLHFGRDRPELLDPLIAHVNGLRPDLVLISGDLTQRARNHQFAAARRLMDQLDAQVLAVPGNHDTPLDNLYVRLLRPWVRFRRHIARDLEPCVSGKDFVVVSLNTTDPLAWQRGRLRRSSLRRASAFLSGEEDRDKIGIVMMHHPPEHDTNVGKRLMRGADKGLLHLRDCGADIVLCGHLHSWRVAPFRAARSLLLVQAGTGLSTRMRGEPNDLNLLILEDGAVVIEHHVSEGEELAFRCESRSVFRKRDGVWNPLP